MKVLVIADDFTGANDTGLQFYQQHISVDVLLSDFAQYHGTAEVVVVNMNHTNAIVTTNFRLF